MATAQDYLMNDKWVKRMDGIFCTFDANKNGYLSAENWMITVDNLGKKSPGRSDAIAKLRKVTKEFTNALGLTEGVKADKEKFRELVANCFTTDTAKMKRGEMASLEKLLKANFDFVDQNGDGYVNFEEFKFIMDATNFGEEATKAVFNSLDKEKNGKMERNDYLSSNLRFWCFLDDPDTHGMFGDKFE